MPVAIVIRCAGRGRRCRRQIGAAETNSGRGPSNPVLLISNQGWALEHGYALLEDIVPKDFSGSTGVLACPNHGKLVTEFSDVPSPVKGWPRGSWTEGEAVRMPYSVLQPAFIEFQRTGVPQTVLWAPGAAPTVHAVDVETRV